MTGWAGTAGHCLMTLVASVFWWPFGFACAGSFIGREIAQAEYRYIQAHGGKRAACPWWCGFHPSAWNAKALADWLLPLGIALGVKWMLW